MGFWEHQEWWNEWYGGRMNLEWKLHKLFGEGFFFPMVVEFHTTVLALLDLVIHHLVSRFVIWRRNLIEFSFSKKRGNKWIDFDGGSEFQDVEVTLNFTNEIWALDVYMLDVC